MLALPMIIAPLSSNYDSQSTLACLGQIEHTPSTSGAFRFGFAWRSAKEPAVVPMPSAGCVSMLSFHISADAPEVM